MKKTKEVEVVYMEEQNHADDGNYEIVEYQNAENDLHEQIMQMELRIMNRFCDLESQFEKRYQKIESMLETLIKQTKRESECEKLNPVQSPSKLVSEPDPETVEIQHEEPIGSSSMVKEYEIPRVSTKANRDLKSMKRKLSNDFLMYTPNSEDIPASKKLNSVITEPLIVEAYEEGSHSTEAVVVEVHEEPDPLEENIIIEESLDESQPIKTKIPTISRIPDFPINDIEQLRAFNRALKSESLAAKFVRSISNIMGNSKEKVPEKILRAIISEQVLVQSTWASKSFGRLRISYLTNILKCCLKAGSMVSENFNLDFFRSKIIDMLQEIRAEHGLAPPKVQNNKNRSND